MIRALRAGLFALLASCPGGALAASACPQQPVPDPIDSARPIGVFVLETISFSAAPSLVLPQEAWVVRAYRETVFEQERRERTMLEVIRMQVEHDCNRHFVTGRWQHELEAGQYAALRQTVVAYLEPVADAVREGQLETAELALDGTSLSVELKGFLWRTRREGNVAADGARGVSNAFYGLAAALLPPGEAPTADWRRRDVE